LCENIDYLHCMIQARQDALEAKRKALLNSLFEMWDNDGSGILDLDEVDTVMKLYKDGMESEAMEKGLKLKNIISTENR